MASIIFVHCAGAQGLGEGSSSLIHHLAQTLGAPYKLHCPQMPDPIAPSCSAWQAQLERELEKVDGKLLLIGHSLGGSVIMKQLSEGKIQRPLAGVFLVAAPYWGIDEDWQSKEYALAQDFPARLPPIPHMVLYHSHEDQLVPYYHVQAYQSKLPQAKVRTLAGSSHYFESGLLQLAEDVRKV